MTWLLHTPIARALCRLSIYPSRVCGPVISLSKNPLYVCSPSLASNSPLKVMLALAGGRGMNERVELYSLLLEPAPPPPISKYNYHYVVRVVVKSTVFLLNISANCPSFVRLLGFCFRGCVVHYEVKNPVMWTLSQILSTVYVASNNTWCAKYIMIWWFLYSAVCPVNVYVHVQGRFTTVFWRTRCLLNSYAR